MNIFYWMYWVVFLGTQWLFLVTVMPAMIMPLPKDEQSSCIFQIIWKNSQKLISPQNAWATACPLKHWVTGKMQSLVLFFMYTFLYGFM